MSEIDLYGQTYEVDESQKIYTRQGIFTKLCACGKKYELRTQRDDEPEYYTIVHLKCGDCSEFVVFNLPVN